LAERPNFSISRSFCRKLTDLRTLPGPVPVGLVDLMVPIDGAHSLNY